MPETHLSHQAYPLTPSILICSDCPGFRAEVLGPGISPNPLQTQVSVSPVTFPTVMNQLHVLMTMQTRGWSPHLPSARLQCWAASGVVSSGCPLPDHGKYCHSNTGCHVLPIGSCWRGPSTERDQGMESHIKVFML